MTTPKLPQARVTPLHYRIHLEPDLERLTFDGRVEIELRSDEPLEEIHLDMVDLAVGGCRQVTPGGEVACSFSVDPGRERLTVKLAQKTQGAIQLAIAFHGRLSDKMAGFYHSRYSAGSGERVIAVTQFQESDARRAFPCFDHPAQKATFDVEMVVEQGLSAVCNTPVAEETPLDGGKQLILFDTTPRMSTYLLFFGVVAFEFLEQDGDKRVRVVTVPGRARYGGFGLDFGRKALDYCEDYYGIAYPLSKLDLIAVPDFAFGAMENWGAITFRENLLLHYPGITSKAAEERICNVIAHEIAHQWFGNLVTPSEWSFLWLNESFATYFGYSVVAHFHPEWDVWAQFLHGQTDVVLNRDALHETFPIEIPGGEHVVINTATAPLIYNKGGSILRQLYRFIGEESFRAGLQHYLRQHAYANAASHHLWEAMETVCQEPVSRIMRGWIEQPGYPLVEVTRQDRRLCVRQARFTYIPGSWDQCWPVPLTVCVYDCKGQSRCLTMLMEEAEAEFDLGPDVEAYKLNPGQSGFYRVKYLDADNLAALGKKVAGGHLPPEDRWGLQNDLYALVKRGDLALRDYLAFLEHYRAETAYLPLMSIASNLYHAHLVLQGPAREAVRDFARGLLEPALEAIGMVPEAGESQTRAILREQLLVQAAVYGSKRATEFATDAFESLKRKEALHPDLQRAVLQVAAWSGDRGTHCWVIERLEESDSEQERMNILQALGFFREPGILEKVRAYVLERVPSRNRFVPLVGMASNPHALPELWEWFLARLEALEALHPIHFERVLAAVVPMAGLGKESEVRDFLKNYTQRRSVVQDVAALSLERLEINRRLRGRGLEPTGTAAA